MKEKLTRTSGILALAKERFTNGMDDSPEDSVDMVVETAPIDESNWTSRDWEAFENAATYAIAHIRCSTRTGNACFDEAIRNAQIAEFRSACRRATNLT